MATRSLDINKQSAATAPLDVAAIRREFPILALQPHGKPLVYLDNAATSQKPRQTIEAMNEYYRTQNANVHRGIHYLSQIATEKYDGTRLKVQQFLNAPHVHEIVYTAGNTDAINLVARAYGDAFIGKGDEILITHMEHHSNIVPWQMLCERTGAVLQVAPVDDNGDIVMDEFKALLNERTKLVSVVYVSNALGTINPVKEIVKLAHDAGAVVLLDSAQAAPHMPVDVQDLDCDFLTIAPHKMFAPMGIGVLYAKERHLEAMPPYRGGGDMILSVSFEKTTYNQLPFKFEAGTPNVAGVVGLGASVDYLMALGMENVAAYEADLVQHGIAVLSAVDGVRLIGTAKNRAGAMSFVMDCAHPHDIGQILDDEGIAIRAGHHCTQPLMQRFGVPATARASVALYNTKEELDALGAALHKVREVFA